MVTMLIWSDSAGYPMVGRLERLRWNYEIMFTLLIALVFCTRVDYVLLTSLGHVFIICSPCGLWGIETRSEISRVVIALQVIEASRHPAHDVTLDHYRRSFCVFVYSVGPLHLACEPSMHMSLSVDC